MPPFTLKYRMCLNDLAVPFVERSLAFHDLHNLAEGDIENQEFLILSLKASADVRWLERAFDLPARWWINHHGSVPLLLEIRQAIETKKVKSGGGSRLPKLPTAIVAIHIREKVILVQNQTLFLSLAFKPGEEIEALQWFLEELEKDIEKLQNKAAPQTTQEQDDDTQEPPRFSKQQKHRVGHEEHQVVQASLNKLLEHSECLRASFLSSRGSFRVIKKDKSSSEFLVSGLMKKRKVAQNRDDDDAWEGMNTKFDKAVASALVFLEGGDADGGDPPQPVGDDARSSAD